MQINQFLEYKHVADGMILEEQEDFVILRRNADVLAVFTRNVTPENIIKEADKHLVCHKCQWENSDTCKNCKVK